MLHPAHRLAVIDGGLQLALGTWDPPRLASDAALLTPRGTVDGRLLLFDRFLEFRPRAHGGRTRVVIEVGEVVDVRRELVLVRRRVPLARGLRIVVPQHREVRLLIDRPQVWVDAVKQAVEAMPQGPAPLSAVPKPA